VSSELARVVLVVVAAATVILLAYWGAKSEMRVEAAHRRILELSEELAATAETAQAAHAQAYRPVVDRRMEEDYELLVKPIDDAVKRAWGRFKSIVFGATP
jgi:ATP/maltotriose-dependent transcriptional regulator MalT